MIKFIFRLSSNICVWWVASLTHFIMRTFHRSRLWILMVHVHHYPNNLQLARVSFILIWNDSSRYINSKLRRRRAVVYFFIAAAGNQCIPAAVGTKANEFLSRISVTRWSEILLVGKFIRNRTRYSKNHRRLRDRVQTWVSLMEKQSLKVPV